LPQTEPQRGLFVTVEGGEGVGKSTNIATIEAWLREQGIAHCLTREPGGTALGEKIRDLLLTVDQAPVAEHAELLLVFAARAQHLRQVIEPALARGEWVICDRFTDATYAYQGAGRQLSVDFIAQLEQSIQGDLRPDCTLLLDAPVELGISRAGVRAELDRFEREQIAFFQRVRACYLDRAAAEPQRFRIIDTARPLEQIAPDVCAILEQLRQASC
jgi:dTMP kinase